MLRNDQIQAALIANLKTRTAIASALVIINTENTINEIREDEWKGREFEYPNIRVRMLPYSPVGDSPDTCNGVRFSASIMVFSEESSSYEADYICGIIASDTHGRSFTQDNIYMMLRVTTVIPAVAADKRVWRSECLIEGIAN